MSPSRREMNWETIMPPYSQGVQKFKGTVQNLSSGRTFTRIGRKVECWTASCPPGFDCPGPLLGSLSVRITAEHGAQGSKYGTPVSICMALERVAWKNFLSDPAASQACQSIGTLCWQHEGFDSTDLNPTISAGQERAEDVLHVFHSDSIYCICCPEALLEQVSQVFR